MPEALKPLTALRFFAALWVVAYAAWPSLGLATPVWVAKGYLGVDLFFCLSGFILCHVYVRQIRDGQFQYGSFLWARLARIYPVHLVTLIGLGAMVMLGEAFGEKSTGNVVVWSSLPAQLSLTQAWGASPLGGWNHPSWSISAEWFAYLCFPLFAGVALAMRARPGLMALAALVILASTATLFQAVSGQSLTHATIAWGALRIMPSFLLGCAVYQVWASKPAWPSAVALSAVLASVVLIGSGISFGAPDWSLIPLFGVLIFGLAGLARLGEGGGLSSVLVYLGEASFSFYMLHVPWTLAYDRAAHWAFHLEGQALPLRLWLFSLLGLQISALALHGLIERPARSFLRRHGPTGLNAAFRHGFGLILRQVSRRGVAV